MEANSWVKGFPCSITVSDREGRILELNDAAAQAYAADGGLELIGQNMLDCHPAGARKKLEEMMAGCQTNVYTIEKNGKKKLIYQAPWYQDGVYAGFVEFAIELPEHMPHFIRG